LRKIAPGFEPHGGMLVPVRGAMNQGASVILKGQGDDHAETPTVPPRDVMDDLVDSLAALEDSGMLANSLR